jgi:hypothetical protein
MPSGSRAAAWPRADCPSFASPTWCALENLKDADVSTSRLSEVKVGVKDLRGLVVSREQAAALAMLLGLVVRC